MQDPKAGGPLDVSGVETRTSGLRGQTRLLIFGGVFVVMALIGLLYPREKPLQPSQSVLRKTEGGGMIFSNAKVTFPLPTGWAISDEQKADELRARSADDTCRALVMRTDLNTTPESFQQGMAKKMQDDGNRITTQPGLDLSGRHAAHMQAQLTSGSSEEIYTVHADGSMYTLVLVRTPGCNTDMGQVAQGFQIAS